MKTSNISANVFATTEAMMFNLVVSVTRTLIWPVV